MIEGDNLELLYVSMLKLPRISTFCIFLFCNIDNHQMILMVNNLTCKNQQIQQYSVIQ